MFYTHPDFNGIGGYTVSTQDGNKKVAGTIPTELGRLSEWKYVVFGKI